MVKIMEVSGWSGALVLDVGMGGPIRFDLGQEGSLTIQGLLSVGFAEQMSPIVDPDEAAQLSVVAQEIAELLGAQVSRAEIEEDSSLNVMFLDGRRLSVYPVPDGEAYEVRQPVSPTVIVCGFGGELFEWD